MKRPILAARFIDLRPGESRIVILSFLVLLLTSAGYTALETARDTLLVTDLPQRQFGIVYIAVAACALPAATLLARVAHRWDPRRVLLALLVLAAVAILAYAALPIGRVVVVAFYVTVALVSTAVFPQFWTLVGTALTVGQGRRLIGPIASASIFGSVVGASIAAVTVAWLHVRGLIPVAAAMLAAAAGVTFFVPNLPSRPARAASQRTDAALATSMSAFQEEPFLLRVAVLVALTTATALVIDYFFKSTVARTVPLATRGVFVARYYAAVNVIALVVQVFLGGAIVRAVGVTTAMLVTPVVSALGGAAALVAGALALPVLALKAADTSLRSSINRLTTELVYLRVSPSGRERAKPFIDGALMRIVQALTAGALLGLTAARLLSARAFGAIVVVLSVSWAVAAMTMRRPYLAQLRQAVAPAAADDTSLLDLDLPSAELLIEHLGSDDATVVVAAMNTLARRGRQRLIPALVLLHPGERVLRRALEIFAAGPPMRNDWHTLAVRLLEHADDRVRIAAASALAAHDKLDFEHLASDSAPAVRGYAALHAALVGSDENLVDHPRIAAALHDNGAALTGLLVAVADAAPSPAVARVLLALADRLDSPSTREWTELLARASVRHGEVAMIPRLLERLSPWDFRTTAAAEVLLDRVEHEPDGLVRYKALRALGRLVVDDGVGVDRTRVEQSMRGNVVSYFGLLGLRVALGAAPSVAGVQSNTFRLLTGLLDDKIRQALERTFRLLKIANPKEDIHRIYLACIGTDKRARANASEWLDMLLRRSGERSLRELLRIVSDDLSSAAQVQRAAAPLGLEPPRSRDEAVEAALADPDLKVAALAALYATATGGERLVASVQKAREVRPSLVPDARAAFQNPAPLR
jgi:AAA family ATP:ADP antiporter